MTTRRDFMAGAGAFAGLGLAGCGSFPGKWLSKARSSTYWCTWATQADTLKTKQATGELNFPGDQGVPGVRDNMNEEVVFGRNGWINLFPEYRVDMVFMVDDGWDVPYGAKGGQPGIHSFASLCPDRERFPSLGVNASDRDRLREFARRTEAKGWKGLGVWVACQAYRERFEAPFTYAQLQEDLKRKFDEAAYAGVKYWKVDWGVHNFHVWYRRLMSELKERYYPELIIDHCRGFNNAVNGQVDPHLHADDEFRHVGRTGRILGVDEYAPITRDQAEIMSFSDVYRTYDSAYPLTTATMLERAVWELKCAEQSSSRVVINTEDEPLIAAGLGVELSMMRCPWVPDPVVAVPRPRHKRMAEDMRVIVWQRSVPPFGSDTPAKVAYSEKSIREDWLFTPNQCWFTGPKEKYFHQSAPAVVSRGLPLPVVKGAGGEVPFILASRHPNGALAVAAVPVINKDVGPRTPKAEISLEAALEPGVPLSVWGETGPVTLRDATAGGRVLARDVLGGEPVDVTAQCVREGGRITLPGELLAKLGSALTPAGDISSPAAVVEVA